MDQKSVDARFSTFFDLFRLPRDFPGLAEHRLAQDTVRRAELLEAAMAEEGDDRRFIPYLQRHETEALVFAGLDHLEELLDATADLEGLQALREEVAGTPPEDIDDGPRTAPLKRLARHIPSYSKTVHGPTVAEATGLPAFRAAGPRFDAWISRLEALGEPPEA